jgi:hypothetical protein
MFFRRLSVGNSVTADRLCAIQIKDKDTVCLFDLNQPPRDPGNSRITADFSDRAIFARAGALSVHLLDGEDLA